MTPPATHRSAIAPVRVETAVGPAPGREEIAMAAPPPVYHTPPPAAVLPKSKPVQNEIRPEVSLEPVRRSVLRTTIGHIPLIGNLGHVRNETSGDFVPARPRRERAPTVPLELSRELRRDEPVLLRIRIAKSGEVSGTELLSRDSNPIFASIALHAASTWDFEPARLKNKAVPSDMLVHFRFPAAR
jgi:Gram-negative bacterial TonB protein C-terminal